MESALNNGGLERHLNKPHILMASLILLPFCHWNQARSVVRAFKLTSTTRGL